MKTFCGFFRNSYSGSALAFALTIALTACGPSTSVDSTDGVSIDEEVTRRVAQLELEQRLADLEQRLEEQSLSVEEKDRLIADQRVLLEEKNRNPQGNPAPAPVAATAPASSPSASAPVLAPGVGNAVDADYSVFYERLEPHGTWLETPQFGEIWQPAPQYTPPGWQPYTRGEWTYADVGWTWVSSEPFGWATYHYGRWSNISNRGWCWIPGNEWAPAWVSWRTSGDYVGWAPLPVQAGFRGNRIGVNIDIEFDSGPGCYNFVPNRYFGSSSIYRYVMPRNQNVAIIENTTNVTNIIRDNNIVINQGPNYTSLNASQVNPIRTARLQREANLQNQTSLNPTFSNGQLRVVAPAVGQGSPAQRAARQRAERLERIETVTGWENVRSPAERQRLREQFARQNQREQARNQAIATAESTADQTTPPARKTLVEQRAQREVQVRRDAAQREREQQARVATAREQVSPASAPVVQQRQTQEQREAQARRDAAQREREQQAKVAAARQQTGTPPPAAKENQAQREAQARRDAAQREREQQARVAAARQQTGTPPPAVRENQAQREAQARRDAAQREREQQERMAVARQEVTSRAPAQNNQSQREVQVRRVAVQREREQQARAAAARQQSAQMQRQSQRQEAPRQSQPQRQSAPSQPNAAQVQAQRQAQARREAAQADREQKAQAEEKQEANAQAQRQRQAMQQQGQQRQPQAQNANAQRQAQARKAAQAQRQQQIQAAQGQR